MHEPSSLSPESHVVSVLKWHYDLLRRHSNYAESVNLAELWTANGRFCVIASNYYRNVSPEKFRVERAGHGSVVITRCHRPLFNNIILNCVISYIQRRTFGYFEKPCANVLKKIPFAQPPRNTSHRPSEHDTRSYIICII